MACPSCGEKAPPDMKWCEACGADLSAPPSPPCTSCGERDISDDGYCMTCGHKQPEERDHLVFEAGAVVAVTDRGRRHRHNEDAAAVGELPDGGAVLVVCDGVSSTPGSAEASLAAATAARDLLVASLTTAQPAHTGAAHSGARHPVRESAAAPQPEGDAAPRPEGDADSGPDAESDPIVEALIAATAAAQNTAAAAPVVESNAPHSQGGPPSSTFVAAVARRFGIDQTELSVAWLGDSRAYWVGADGALQLTGDHEEEGSLTRWLGADSVDSRPDVTRYLAEGPGRLLLCSDGLWRYAESVAELAELVGRLESEHGTTKALAEALVAHAVDSGGHDNITVALWPVTGDESLDGIGAGQPADAATTPAPPAAAADLREGIETADE